MTSGKTFRLADYRGKNLVLYFYPKDNTPGCTAESMDFRDLMPQFEAVNAEIFGVSRDSLRSHEGFRAKFGMPFELISDTDETLCTMFNVMKMKSMYGKQVRGIERSTFLIDGNGKLVEERRGVRVPGHADAILDLLKTLV